MSLSMLRKRWGVLFGGVPNAVCLQVYGVFLNMLTATHSMEACEAAFLLGVQWFEAWAGAGRGDVEPSEMTIIAQQVCAGAGAA